MNEKVKLVLALVALAGAGGYLAYFYRSQPRPGATVVHTQPLCCAACGKAFVADAGDPPVACKFCGQPTAWGAGYCSRCKLVIPLTKAPGQRAYKCPKCGGTAIREPTLEEVTRQGG